MTFEKVKEIIVEQLGLEESEVKEDTSFEALGLDSLDIVELLMAIEEEFGVEISDEEAEGIHTVGDALAYVKEHI